MAAKNIVILGAGYAGVHAAKKLAKKYKKNNDVTITIIDKNPYHTLMTELHEVAGGRVPEESVKLDLHKIFHRTKVNVVVDYIENVDLEKQVVKTTHGTYAYSYLMVGLGSEPAYFGVPGVKEHGFSLWSLDDALTIREHIKEQFKKASLERDEKRRRELLTFIVAGAGFTGIEMAGELLEWKDTLAAKYHVDVEEVKVYVVEAAGSILNMLDQQQAAKAEKYMTKHKIEVMKNAPITEVTAEGITLKDGRKIATHTLIWTCGIQCAESAVALDAPKTRANRLKANEYMQAEGYENVYVIGDCAYNEENGNCTNPQIVEAAEQTAATAAKNIIASIDNKEKSKFKGNYHGFMVSIGGRYGVANLSGIKLSGFFAMVMKHIVNMYYLFGVLNVYAVYHYLQHEFFGMKQNRNIMRGHISSLGNRLWTLPLRFYIGILWLIEGLKKLVGEGTWDAAWDDLLQKGEFAFTIGSDSWIKAGNVKMPFEWLYDAVSSASQAGDAATTFAEPILKEMPNFYESIMQIFIPNPDVAVFFQTIVVATEIGIGLALIAGLFTWLASAASAFMVINFVLSAMAGWDILWFFFGSIALMNGSGRTFGLDHYVLPWINKVVGDFWVGGKGHIYKK